jgi:phosphoribosylformylglycinamidine cyclo-ligase
LLFEVARHTPRAQLPELTSSLADELLKIHKSYLTPIQALHSAKLLKGAAHITGGGLTGNVPRILPRGCAVQIDPHSWPSQAIFELLQRLGNIPEDDFRRTFNLGIGMVLIVAESKIGFVSQILKKLREPFSQIGRVIQLKSPRQPRVVYL